MGKEIYTKGEGRGEEEKEKETTQNSKLEYSH